METIFVLTKSPFEADVANLLTNLTLNLTMAGSIHAITGWYDHLNFNSIRPMTLYNEIASKVYKVTITTDPNLLKNMEFSRQLVGNWNQMASKAMVLEIIITRSPIKGIGNGYCSKADQTK